MPHADEIEALRVYNTALHEFAEEQRRIAARQVIETATDLADWLAAGAPVPGIEVITLNQRCWEMCDRVLHSCEMAPPTLLAMVAELRMRRSSRPR